MKPDVNKPVENPILSGLLKEYRETSEEQKRDVLEKICEEIAMKAYLLTVININKESLEDKGDGTATFTKDTNLSFEMFAAPDGSRFLPVYTDWKNLHAGGNYNDREVNTLIVSFDDIVAITGGKSEVARPYLSEGMYIDMVPFSDDFGRGAAEGEPFYKRKRGLFR